jgi:predicted Fe-Mo cluster-binding NifX family protein
MSERMVLAVPSDGEGGMTGVRSGHFGHCDCFTLVDIVDGKISEVRIVENAPHESGGCLAPVSVLASHGVTALLAAGMGARPLAGFNDAGISVYFETEIASIADAVQLVLSGAVETMDGRHACGGCH